MLRPRYLSDSFPLRKVPPSMLTFHKTILGCLLMCSGVLSGCSPQIGDGCTTSTDCLFNGARTCDRTLSDSGYCTIFSCEANTCPAEAWCVQFRSEPARTTVSWCMRRCENDSDCRVDEGYRCIQESDYEDKVAVILDGSGLGFCGIP